MSLGIFMINQLLLYQFVIVEVITLQKLCFSGRNILTVQFIAQTTRTKMALDSEE